MNKREGTRQRILRNALEMASLDGLEGVSLGPLAERVHLSKSGLFAHFRSKEALQIQVLDTAAELFQQTVLHPASQAPQGLPRLRALFTLWLGWASRAGLPGGCPIVRAMAEFDESEGEIRDYLVDTQKVWFQTFQQFVEQAVTSGDLRSDLDLVQFTWDASGIYLMHHTASRFLRDATADQRALTAFEALIASARYRPS
jgi:AcrR family transcriptional regulator